MGYFHIYFLFGSHGATALTWGIQSGGIPMIKLDQFVTIKQAAKMLGVQPGRLRQRIMYKIRRQIFGFSHDFVIDWTNRSCPRRIPAILSLSTRATSGSSTATWRRCCPGPTTPRTCCKRPPGCLAEVRQYRPSEPFLPWACAIARYEVLNYCQRERTRRKHFRPAVIELLADARLKHDDLFEAQSRWLEECLREARGDRPPVDRAALRQRGNAGRAGRGIRPHAQCTYKSMQRVRRTLLECIENGLKSEGWK